jgi:predicted  nucleic acid-binding Zn-ribbon protein
MALNPDSKDWPTDRLRFEYEKRQREISNLQMEVLQLSQLEDSLWEQGYEYQSSGAEVAKQKGGLQRRVAELKGEMNEIEQILESKWK